MCAAAPASPIGTRLGRSPSPATHLVMSPLAWGWLLSTLDTTGPPLFAVGGSES